MAKAVSIEMDSRNLEGAIRALSKLTGRDLSEVIDLEAIKVLEGAVKNQKAARVKDIKDYYERRQWGMYKSSFQPKQPFKGKLSKNGFKRYYLRNFYPDALWNEIQNQNSNHFATAKKARGLLKKAWAQLGSDLGLNISVPSYARSATTKRGDYPGNTSGRRNGTGAAYYIEGTNARPYARSDRSFALQMAMRGRVRFFQQNLKLGVFNNAESIAKAYPGLVINRS
jgi:hypothetical protein